MANRGNRIEHLDTSAVIERARMVRAVARRQRETAREVCAMSRNIRRAVASAGSYSAFLRAALAGSGTPNDAVMEFVEHHVDAAADCGPTDLLSGRN